MSVASLHTQADPDPHDATLVMLWAHYTVAARRAQQSLRIDDGLEAGKVWAAWLNAFALVPAVRANKPPKQLPVQP